MAMTNGYYNDMTFVHKYPGLTKFILGIIAVVIVIAAIAVPFFGDICMIMIIGFVLVAFFWAIAGITYEFLSAVTPKYKRPRRYDR